MNRYKKGAWVLFSIVAICVFLIFAIIPSFGFVFRLPNAAEDPIVAPAYAEFYDGKEALGADEIHALPHKLSFTRAGENGKSVDIRVRAEVKPATAINKAVDYTIAWGEAPTHGSEPVQDYATVAQDSDGSPEATISCFKGFGNDTIIVTVITREGGFKDTCELRFEGRPSEIRIESDGYGIDKNGVYMLAPGECSFSLSAYCPVWETNGNYNDFEVVEIGGCSQKLTVTDYEVRNTTPGYGGRAYYFGNEDVCTFDEFVKGVTHNYVTKVYPNEDQTHSGSTKQDLAQYVTIDGSTLKISFPASLTMKGLVSGFKIDSESDNFSSYRYGVIKGILNDESVGVEGYPFDPNSLYFTALIRERRSGVETLMRFRVVDDAVIGVEFAEDQIVV